LSLSDTDPFYRTPNDAWVEGLRRAFSNLPPFEWEGNLQRAQHVQTSTTPAQSI
jgi:predicted proteasome-type protease